MTTAKRRINSTGRKRIRHESVDIRMIQSDPGQPLRASAALDLGEHKFPPDALLSIEAYNRYSGMRFDCATIGQPAIPDVLVLSEVDLSGSVLFRVKVIEGQQERGRILGSAERIQPLSENEDKDRRSLFPVMYRSLGEQIWKVEINPDDRPKLIINREIPGIQHRMKHDVFLHGMLFPAAFRIVMEALAESFQDESDEDDEQPGWQTEWLKFCQENLSVNETPPSKDADARHQWVEYAVDRFCAAHGFMNVIRKMEIKKLEEETPA